MKYLGIDFGTKRVGVAVSDDTGSLAFPYSVVPNDDKLLAEILAIIKTEKVGGVVVGESKDFKGEPNKIMKAIEKFVEILKTKTNLPIFLEPEFMTSAEALHLQGKTAMHDASAATIILQSYLNRLQ